MRRRATPPWFQWKQVNKSKQAAQKLALMAVECGWSYLPVCVCVCVSATAKLAQHNDTYCPTADNRAEARGPDVMLHFTDPRGCNVNPHKLLVHGQRENPDTEKKKKKTLSTLTRSLLTHILIRLTLFFVCVNKWCGSRQNIQWCLHAWTPVGQRGGHGAEKVEVKWETVASLYMKAGKCDMQKKESWLLSVCLYMAGPATFRKLWKRYIMFEFVLLPR